MHLPHLPLPGLRASLPVKIFTTRTNPAHRIGAAVNYWHAFKYDQIGRVSRYVVVSNTDDNNSVRGTVRGARVTRFLRLFTPLRARESDARNSVTYVYRAIRYGRHERPVQTLPFKRWRFFRPLLGDTFNYGFDNPPIGYAVSTMPTGYTECR